MIENLDKLKEEVNNRLAIQERTILNRNILIRRILERNQNLEIAHKKEIKRLIEDYEEKLLSLDESKNDLRISLEMCIKHLQSETDEFLLKYKPIELCDFVFKDFDPKWLGWFDSGNDRKAVRRRVDDKTVVVFKDQETMDKYIENYNKIKEEYKDKV